MTQKGYNNDLKEIPFDTIGAFNKQSVETMTDMQWNEVEEKRRQEGIEQKRKIEYAQKMITDLQKTKRSLELRSARLDVREQKANKREVEFQCRETVNGLLIEVERQEMRRQMMADLQREKAQMQAEFDRKIELEQSKYREREEEMMQICEQRESEIEREWTEKIITCEKDAQSEVEQWRSKYQTQASEAN